MRKGILIWLVLILIFGGAINAYGNTNYLKEDLTKYFKNEFEVKKNLTETENKMLLKDGSQFLYNSSYERYMIRLYKELNIKIEEYYLELNINSVEKVEERIRVDVDKNVTLKYSGIDEKSSYTDNHIIYLKRVEGRLFVEVDIFERGEIAENIEEEIKKNFRGEKGNEGYINKKIEIINELEKSIDKDLNNIRGGGLKEGYFRGAPSKAYNGEKAAKWAVENVFVKPDYDSDCTNFVSKALNAGGLKQDNIWYTGSNTWIRVNGLRDYLISKKLAKELKSMDNIKVGDIIQLRKTGVNNKWGWQHSLIVTDIDKEGRIFVSARTNPARNIGVWEYYPSTRWEEFRVLHIL